eukprot:TRINITY_DN23970_c0_g6_i1.p1 TRINITY_DN23970_c0_g6~~TRINITY_DN23970_c0_g6_i1.p1  ORF type:complete len:866 (-),score=115.12 TRINITY_DN23970_c0_g6_i1:445-3042(-)
MRFVYTLVPLVLLTALLPRYADTIRVDEHGTTENIASMSKGSNISLDDSFNATVLENAQSLQGAHQRSASLVQGLASAQRAKRFLPVIGVIIMAMISIAMTAWDFWEKGNAMVMIYSSMKAMNNIKDVEKKYSKYADMLSECGENIGEEVVTTMETVATFFLLLQYSVDNCGRPDMDFNWWFSRSIICTRDAAAQRIERLYDTICAADYSRYLVSMEQTMESNNETEKAQSLHRSTCTVCAYGYLTNMNKIQDAFDDGDYGALYEKMDLSTNHGNMVASLQLELESKFNMTMDDVRNSSCTHVSDECPVPLVAIRQLEEYRHLKGFHGRCQKYLNSLGIWQRGQTTGKDRINEELVKQFLQASHRIRMFAETAADVGAQVWDEVQTETARALEDLQSYFAKDGGGVQKMIKDGLWQLEHFDGSKAEKLIANTSDTVQKTAAQAWNATRKWYESTFSQSGAEEDEDFSMFDKDDDTSPFTRNARCTLLAQKVSEKFPKVHSAALLEMNSSVQNLATKPLPGLSQVVNQARNFLETAMPVAIGSLDLDNLQAFGFGYVNYVSSLPGHVAKMSDLATKFSYWVSVGTFLATVIANILFSGFNYVVCPRISEWIEMLNEGAKDRANDTSTFDEEFHKGHEGVEACNVRNDYITMMRQVHNRIKVTGVLKTLKGVPESDLPVGAQFPTFLKVDLLKKRDSALQDLMNELDVKVVCINSTLRDSIIEYKWKDVVDDEEMSEGLPALVACMCTGVEGAAISSRYNKLCKVLKEKRSDEMDEVEQDLEDAQNPPLEENCLVNEQDSHFETKPSDMEKNSFITKPLEVEEDFLETKPSEVEQYSSGKTKAYLAAASDFSLDHPQTIDEVESEET